MGAGTPLLNCLDVGVSLQHEKGPPFVMLAHVASCGKDFDWSYLVLHIQVTVQKACEASSSAGPHK